MARSRGPEGRALRLERASQLALAEPPREDRGRARAAPPRRRRRASLRRPRARRARPVARGPRPRRLAGPRRPRARARAPRRARARAPRPPRPRRDRRRAPRPARQPRRARRRARRPRAARDGRRPRGAGRAPRPPARDEAALRARDEARRRGRERSWSERSAGSATCSRGRSTSTRALEGRLGGRRPVLATLDGAGSLRIAPGRLRGVGLLRTALDTAAKVGQAAKGGPGAAADEGDRFDSLAGRFVVERRRRPHRRSAPRATPATRLELRGSVGLADQRPRPAGALAVVAGARRDARRRRRGRSVALASVRGTVDDPEVELTREALAGAASAYTRDERRRKKWEKKLDERLGEGQGEQVLQALDKVIESLGTEGGGREARTPSERGLVHAALARRRARAARPARAAASARPCCRLEPSRRSRRAIEDDGRARRARDRLRRRATAWRCAADVAAARRSSALRAELAAARAHASRRTRPTAVNLFCALGRMRGRARRGARARPVRRARASRARCAAGGRRASARRTSRAAARSGAPGSPSIPTDARILTHCNAGALATAGYGTALGVIRAAARRAGGRRCSPTRRARSSRARGSPPGSSRATASRSR